MKLTTGILAMAMMVSGLGALGTEPGRHRQRAQHCKIAAAEAGQRYQRGSGRRPEFRRQPSRRQALRLPR